MSATTWLIITRAAAAILIVLTAVVYLRGWRQLQGRYPTEPGSPASRRSRFYFLFGLVLLAFVLVSPLAALSLQYFSARIVQHMMLVASVPSFLLLANPAPALVFGLPARLRRSVSLELTWAESGAAPPDTVRRFLHWATSPGVTLLAFLCVCWLWYDPALQQATITNGLLHDIELLSLFAVGLLNWWHITAALPRVHPPMSTLLRVFYTFLSIWPIKIVGLILLAANQPFYSYPATWSTSGLAINDYVFGAMVAWVVSGFAYVVAGILLMQSVLGRELSKPVLPEHVWANDELVIAPSFGQQQPRRPARPKPRPDQT